MSENWNQRRVTVMGLGRFGGGVGVAQWLARAGAQVTVTDQAPTETLADSVRQLDGLPITFRLGGHADGDFRETDLIVVNPAVPESSPFLRLARDAGIPITTEINLFVERCAARCVGVTGSVGKSTTTAMIGHVLEKADAARRVWVGGNIGRSLLAALDEIRAADLVVLELSSFQLERTPFVRWSPSIAVLTNVTPNHLDWHGSFEAYRAAKLNLLRFQNPGRDAAILYDSDELYAQVCRQCGERSNVWRYGLKGDAPRVVSALEDRPLEIQNGLDSLRLSVPGRHNRENAAAVLAVAHVLGVAMKPALHALAGFEGLPHRLQRVAVRDGVTYYNDSKSTTPEAALTAMAAMDAPFRIILGGYDKQIDLTPAARGAAGRAKFAACIGQTGPALARMVRDAGGEAEALPDLAAAIAACRKHAQAGEAVLLSPACASWDQFADYRTRGELFTRLANE